ncbi:transmembrane protein, putative [Medicago truncatula]|uniref:Transmembrane protein, putative n=1 Tax=Medicago truncatula TaxID=3880 RepID=A0A072UJI2_MEDTR|nr:transmembrane protein, putative [Medicago truncatula]
MVMHTLRVPAEYLVRTILKIPWFTNNAFIDLLAGLEVGLLAVFVDSHVVVVYSLPEVCT